MLPLLLLLLPFALACDTCYGPSISHARHVRRMQPEAIAATIPPKAPLDWGQLNFLHTTDTHGYLEGHLKEENYGADWGDYAGFVQHMRDKAEGLGVDLVLVDTGDLHDGTGLSDATSPNGAVSNLIHEKVQYDVLTIGNHELYVTEIAYETASQFAAIYGERYLTSNVQLLNPSTGSYDYIGKQYRYFTTPHGVNILAFGVLFNFTGNSNVSKITPAASMVEEAWFTAAIARDDVDLFMITGHNPVRPTDESSTMGTVYDAIRAVKPDVPILLFGGHTHIRDFAVYDESAVGIESGRYCETLGWLAMGGIEAGNATKKLEGVPNASRPAVAATKTGSAISTATSVQKVLSSSAEKKEEEEGYRYARRYLDWNRLTFEYHTNKTESNFNTSSSNEITQEIYEERLALNLTEHYGCAPQSYCISCAPMNSSQSIFPLLQTALASEVVNASRASTPRLIIINTGSIRFDLYAGPFTFDDSFIVSPFRDAFLFFSDVPYDAASQVLGILNAGAYQKRSLAPNYVASFEPLVVDACTNPAPGEKNTVFRREEPRTVGYTTVDDFGSDGDDTPHVEIPYYEPDNDLQAHAGFAEEDEALPERSVDLVFLDFIVRDVVDALASVGVRVEEGDAAFYVEEAFTTHEYLPAYARKYWKGSC